MREALVDFHAHLNASAATRASAVDALLAMMDRCRIERTVVVPGGTVTPELLAAQIARGGELDVEPNNEGVYSACQATAGRLIPFFFANPHRGPNSYRDAGRLFAGLKIGPAVHGVAFADARITALVEVAQEFGHCVYLHCLPRVGFDVTSFLRLAATFPKVTFVLGHAGVGQCDFDAVARVLPYGNVMFEMSGGMSSVCAAAIRQLGAQRVLFGSEYPLQDPRIEITKLETLDLDASAFRLVTRDNALGLIGQTRLSCAA